MGYIYVEVGIIGSYGWCEGRTKMIDTPLEVRTRELEQRFADVGTMVPRSAYHVIQRVLGEVQSGVELDPAEAMGLRETIVDALYDAKSMGSLHSLSKAYQRAAEYDCRRGTVAHEVLTGLAVTVGLLTGQKPGSRYEPEALR